jgi:hypothetical protein
MWDRSKAMISEHKLQLLGAYFDGETTPEESVEVEGWLESCPDSRAEFERLGNIKLAMAARVDTEMQQVDFGALWKNIESEISKEVPVRAPIVEDTLEESGSVWQKIVGLFSAQPLVPAGAMALLVAAVVMGTGEDLKLDGGDVNGGSPGTELAQGAATSEEGTAQEKGTEPAEGQSHLAFVSGLEYESGTVFVDQDMDDPTQPLIVWHIENEGDEPSQGG